MQNVNVICKHPSESSYLTMWTKGYEKNQLCIQLLTTLSGFAHITKCQLLLSGCDEYFWAEMMK